MRGTPPVLEALNELLALELTVINQYVVHSKVLGNAGYTRLAERFRQVSMEEMRDAEEVIERIVFLEGSPRVRLGAVALAERPADMLRLHLKQESRAVELLAEGVRRSIEQGDQGSREFFARRIPEEEGHLDWLETQLALIEEVGEANYLSQQIRG